MFAKHLEGLDLKGMIDVWFIGRLGREVARAAASSTVWLPGQAQ